MRNNCEWDEIPVLCEDEESVVLVALLSVNQVEMSGGFDVLLRTNDDLLSV